MSDDPPQPEWRHLPHDAQAFFGLEAGFDRKGLKRAYNGWIRQFKPETHPAEFQKIRAAYEQLDQMLRYGGGLTSFRARNEPGENHSWREVDRRDEPSSPARQVGDETPAAALPAELHERVATEPPEELYAELQRKPDKSPYDYYALALLSDVCDRRDGLQFARWLLEGLKRHAGDYALGRLFQAYLRGPLPKGSLKKLLVAAASAIGSDAFYPITEPGWELLLREQTLASFVAALRKCESQLRDIGIAGKMAFKIRMLRLAFWKTRGANRGAMAWTAEAMEFIESNFEQIPGELEFEVDLLAYIYEYQKVRLEFIAASPLRQRMDAALERYFCGEAIEGDHAIVQQQLEIAADPEGLLAAYPAGVEDPALDAFFPLWAWVSGEVAERNAESEPEEINVKLWAGRAHALLVQLEAKSDGSTTGQVWNLAGLALQVSRVLIYFVVWIAVFIAIAYAGYVVGGRDNDDLMAWLVIGSLLTATVSTIYGGSWLSKQLLERVYYPYCHRMALRSYKKLWRRDALDLLGRSRLPYTLLRDLIARQASDQISTSHWVSNYFSQDYALAIYSYAQRHVV